MDFIERLFDVSPDGGDGRLEITLILVALFMLAVALLVGRIRAAARGTSRPISVEAAVKRLLPNG